MAEDDEPNSTPSDVKMDFREFGGDNLDQMEVDSAPTTAVQTAPNFAPLHIFPGVGMRSAQNKVQNVAVIKCGYACSVALPK
jgi:hypothetical protein